jgi:hypothetical protein
VGLAGRVHQSGWDSFDAGGSDADQIEGALLSMLTQGEDVEAHALKERGWAISAIARHLERDRKTVRSYLNGDRQPGVRVTVVVDALPGSRVMSGRGSLMIRICGRHRFSTRSSPLATRAAIRCLYARFASVACGRTAKPARAEEQKIQWYWFENQYALAGEGHAPTDVTPPDLLVQRRRAVRAGQDLVPSAASRTAPPPRIGADSVADRTIAPQSHC